MYLKFQKPGPSLEMVFGKELIIKKTQNGKEIQKYFP